MDSGISNSTFKQPRTIGSISSLFTSPSRGTHGYSSSHRTSVLDVPEDVSPGSHTQSPGVLCELSERDVLAGHLPLSTTFGRTRGVLTQSTSLGELSASSRKDKVLGVKGGRVAITQTVQRQASF